MKKLLALTLAVLMVVSMFAGCGKKDQQTDNGPATYTYKTYTSALGTCWNPHTWETNADSAIAGYLETPLTDITIKDSAAGEYQWIFVACTDIKDVTADHQEDLVKYNCAETEAEAGYVYEITLREEICWQDGTPINADTYVYSMKALLDPAMRNYRAGTFVDGDGALAGAYNYFYQGTTPTKEGADLSTLVKGEDGVYTTDDGEAIWIALDTELGWLGGYSLDFYVNYFGATYFDVDAYATLRGMADENGNIPVTDESMAVLLAVISVEAWGEGAGYEGCYMLFEDTIETCDYDSTVGLYKVDDYTIRYVCATAYDYYYFLTSMTSNWLVYEDLYEAGKDTTGELVTTDYGTSLETTMSYGAYKMTSLQEGKQVVFEQNENYWEFTKNEDGTLSSTTFFTVDGEYVSQYQTQKIVIDVMTDDAAKLAFLAGELDDWAPAADEVPQYTTSDQLYQVDETYTMRLFFNDNLDALKAMDQTGNKNSVVMSNYNFRRAFSLAIDRADWVTATAGYKPAYYLLNYLYFYDVYEDPTSIYRNTEEAMQAICNLYGVEYGEGTPYANLEEAFKSINGYNLTEAKNLFTQACNELVEAGLYTAGEEIIIEIGWSSGTMDSSAQQQVTLLNEYINAAVEGTGFGHVTLKAVENIPDRYSDVVNGVYAIGYGAWGGAAFYPFNAIGCYTDADYAGTIHESGSWDPATTYLTLTINGEEESRTYEDWSRSIKGTGDYANADAEVKLAILAGLEQGILEQYHCIPLATMASASLLSYKVSYYTENYSIMYGFGGLRLMRYNYTDSEWASYVQSQNGTLSYT